MRIVINRIVVCALVCLAFVITGPVQLTGAAPSPPPSFLLKWGTAGAGNGEFSNPSSMAVDASGNIYVADSGNHRIQKFTGSGVFVAQWGIFGFGDGEFMDPRGVAVDGSGNVYVTDSGNNRIQKFTGDGVFITKWGTFGSNDGQFLQPMGLAVDALGDVYVADFANSQIQKFTGAGTFITRWGTRGFGDGEFAYPMAVAVDAAGDVYVADTSNNRIQKFTSSGVFITKWGTFIFAGGEFNQPMGLAVDVSGNVYVADRDNHQIQKFTSDGGFITRWGIQGSGDGEFESPEAVAVDAAGNVYVTDTGNSRIQVFGEPPTGGDVVELTVYETITVTDSNVVLPPVVLTVNENVNVADAPVALPPVVLTVNENVNVADAPVALPPVSLTVTEMVSVADGITAAPSTPPVTIIASVAGGHGIVSPSSQITVYNANVSVSIVPDAGYHIAGIVDNGIPSAIANPYVIPNATVNHTLVVTFAINTYTITAGANFGGSISPASQTVDFGTDARIIIIPDTGYHIESIVDNGNHAAVTSPYVIVNVSANHTVVVSFAASVPSGLKQMIQDVLRDLTELRRNVTDKHDREKLDEAIKHLAKALTPSWWEGDSHLDEKNGGKVFNEVKDALNKLDDLMEDKKSAIPDAVLRDFIDRLVDVVRQLVQTAITGSAADQEDIAKALKELGSGDSDAAKGKYESALEHYRNAWEQAGKSQSRRGKGQ